MGKMQKKNSRDLCLPACVCLCVCPVSPPKMHVCVAVCRLCHNKLTEVSLVCLFKLQAEVKVESATSGTFS